mmetsp:Transcript_2873/g.7687  ORF Transcript_2873/g.7687 Transcript_2873/m.7687 type:complete len:253 (-) Transcript_2873:450-1208(-)
MRNRFFSSSSVNESTSCCGSRKHSSCSSSDDTSTYSLSTRLSSSSLLRCSRFCRCALSRSLLDISSSSSSRRLRPLLLGRASASCAASEAALCSARCSSSARRSSTTAILSSIHACRRLAFLADFSCACDAFHSSGVSLDRNSLYRAHSSPTSRSLPMSLSTPAICCRISLIRSSFFCLSFVNFSASSLHFLSLSILLCRRSSNLFASSSSISWDFARASSFSLAFSSRRWVSAFLTSQDMCAKKISRFLCT